MSELTERNCSHCRLPLPVSDSGLRHYGTHTAHQEYECLRLLHAEIERLTKQRDEYARQAVGLDHTLAGVESEREELLGALKGCLDEYGFVSKKYHERIKKAIAKAEGKTTMHFEPRGVWEK